MGSGKACTQSLGLCFHPEAKEGGEEGLRSEVMVHRFRKSMDGLVCLFVFGLFRAPPSA